MPQWFLYLQGFAMLIMGVMLVRMRPHPPDAGFYTKYVNLGTLWALLCCATGIALLAMAQGYWDPFPKMPEKAPSIQRHR